MTFLKAASSFKGRTPRTMQRYSRLIKVLRLGVPLVVMGGLAIFAIDMGYHNTFSPQVHEATVVPTVSLENQLIQAKLICRDSKGQPLMIKAEKATQKDNTAFLELPETQVQLETGGTLNITSSTAVYNKDTETVTYENNVQMKSLGMCLTTEKAVIDIEKNTASGQHSVSGQGPQGQVQAQGFKWDQDTLWLTGKSRLVIN